jgi:hypothetical protein
MNLPQLFPFFFFLKSSRFGFGLLIIFNLIMDIFKGYAGLLKHGFRIPCIMVAPLADHPDDAAVHQEHGAGSARGHPTIQGSPCYSDAPFRSLTDGVLFRVNRSDAMGGNASIFVDHLFKLMPCLITMGQPSRSAHIAGYEDLVILGNDTA